MRGRPEPLADDVNFKKRRTFTLEKGKCKISKGQKNLYSDCCSRKVKESFWRTEKVFLFYSSKTAVLPWCSIILVLFKLIKHDIFVFKSWRSFMQFENQVLNKPSAVLKSRRPEIQSNTIFIFRFTRVCFI